RTRPEGSGRAYLNWRDRYSSSISSIGLMIRECPCLKQQQNGRFEATAKRPRSGVAAPTGWARGWRLAWASESFDWLYGTQEMLDLKCGTGALPEEIGGGVPLAIDLAILTPGAP